MLNKLSEISILLNNKLKIIWLKNDNVLSTQLSHISCSTDIYLSIVSNDVVPIRTTIKINYLFFNCIKCTDRKFGNHIDRFITHSTNSNNYILIAYNYMNMKVVYYFIVYAELRYANAKLLPYVKRLYSVAP